MTLDHRLATASSLNENGREDGILRSAINGNVNGTLRSHAWKNLVFAPLSFVLCLPPLAPPPLKSERAWCVLTVFRRATLIPLEIDYISLIHDA